EFRGSTGLYIQPTPGEASLNIFRMIREDLSLPLRLAINEAKTNSRSVRKEGVELHLDHDKTLVNLEVIRLRSDARGRIYYLVLFEMPARQKGHDERIVKKEPASPTSRRIEKLEEQLRSADDRLRSIIEERDSTNQEVQSANEEILASNEELQSMNEEMQT